MHLSAPPSPLGLALTAADFDAFDADGWDERAAERDSLEKRAITWAKLVSRRLFELGGAFEMLSELRAPHQLPALFRLVFVRDKLGREQVDEVAERASLREVLGVSRLAREATLSFRLSSDGVAVAFELPLGAHTDRRNLRGRLSEPSSLLELIGALEALPDEFSLTLGASDPSVARETTADGLRDLLERSELHGEPLAIAWHIPRAIAVSNADALDELLEDALVAMGYVYEAIAWAPDNDYLPMHHGQRGERPLPNDRNVDRRDQLLERRTSSRRKEEPAEETEEQSAPWSGSNDPADTTAPKAPAIHAALRARDSARLRSSVGRRGGTLSDVDPHAPVEKGSRVRVMSGPFEGTAGVVQELDGKGGARVRLGLLSTRVLVKALSVTREGRERPALASSHRRPNPAR